LLTRISTRLATPADLDALAPLFDAYRQFYEQPANVALARAFLAQRMHSQESVILLAIRNSPSTVADAAATTAISTAPSTATSGEPTGPIIGFCQLYPTFCSVEAQPIYALYDLFVQPEERRSGAGKALLLAAEQLAAAHGKARMDLTTARTNLTAQAAYESLGWVQDEVFFAYSKVIACNSKSR
jgi:ribosomal protein S18 acetylase RimI-like enzyme